MQFAAIILLSIMAAIFYGVIHDQITARICVEYFTIGHEDVFHTQNPTLLGFGWGVIATWWAGLLIGIPLAIAARSGGRPKRSVSSLLRPVGILLGVMAGCAILMGFIGNIGASLGLVFLVEPMRSAIPPGRQVAFITDLWIHLGSYGAGLIGGIVLCIQVWRAREPAAARMKVYSAPGGAEPSA